MSMQAIDLFAGAGGFSEGAKQAGVSVLWAANHWPAAVATHMANHPESIHACQDLEQADWSRVPKHDLLLASPACQGHSKARGKDRPHHDAARSTAWAVVSAIEAHKPKAAIVENVPEFLQWQLFPAWRESLSLLGYTISPHILDAAKFGIPQHRERVFIVITPSKTPLLLRLEEQAKRPASCFLSFETGRWSMINKANRAQATLDRVAAGRKVHGKRFVISYYGNSKSGHSIEKPIGTITTHDRHALIDGDRMRMLTVQECKAAMTFPASYKLPRQHAVAMKMLGNAVCPQLASRIIKALVSAV